MRPYYSERESRKADICALVLHGKLTIDEAMKRLRTTEGPPPK